MDDERILVVANPDRMAALAGLVDTDPDAFELALSERVPPGMVVIVDRAELRRRLLRDITEPFYYRQEYAVPDAMYLSAPPLEPRAFRHITGT